MALPSTHSPPPRALVVLPTYNERENLPLMVAALLALPRPVDVLVVDDGSPDGTGDLADGLARDHACVHVLHRKGKLGLGTAYLAGFRYAIDEGYELTMSMDCDFSHNPKYIPDMLARAETADLVIGSRYVPGGGTEGWGLHRRIISCTANALVRIMLGVRVYDTTAGFRCWRAEALKTLGLAGYWSTGYSLLEEMVFRAERKGLRVAEVPIVFTDRERGQTKISLRDMIGVGLMLWRFLYDRLTCRP